VKLCLKWQTWAALAAAVVALFAGLRSANADPPWPAGEGHATNGLCLACHDHELTVGAEADTQRTIGAVDQEAFKASAHEGMKCVECHASQSALPHIESETLGKLEGLATAACQRCHAEVYEGYIESPHGTMVKLGDDRAPTCTDCHGDAHYIALIDQWKEDDRAEACATCHSGASTNFLSGAPLHKAASPGFLSTAYVAGIFLMLLTAATLALGIIHVELEMLRWLVERFSRWRQARTTSDGHAG
jgi:hypothetical protein